MAALTAPEETRASPQQTRKAQKRIKELEREVNRKDKALAGACQDSCRLNHTTSFGLSCTVSAALIIESRSGFRVTAPTGIQFRVEPDHRRGLASRALM